VKEIWENPTSRKLFFAGMIGSITVGSVPLFAMINIVNPTILPVSAALATLVMGGTTLYSLRAPLGKFSSWKAGLSGALLGLVGMNLISIASFMIMGPNLFTMAAMKIDTYAGLALFSAYQIYDTQQAVQDFQNGHYDHLEHVTQMFLNFVNIFQRIAQILMRMKND